MPLYHGNGLPSRRKPPVGQLSGGIAAQTARLGLGYCALLKNSFARRTAVMAFGQPA